MKKFEFESNGSVWRLEEASNKHLGRVLLKYITEEQASEVVDEIEYHPISSKDQLLFLLKSKGVHLYKNPYRDDWEELCVWGHGCFAKDGKSSFELFTEAESKTFYNPVLFKIICN